MLSLHGLDGFVGPGALLQVALVLHFSPHGGVPVILDGVVRPAGGLGEREALTFACSGIRRAGSLALAAPF